MFVLAGAKVAEQLGYVFVGQSFDSFQFHNEAIFDEQIGEILAENRAVLIAHRERVLLNDFQASFPQTVGETVLINFFKMPVPVITVERESGFTDEVTQGEDFFFSFHFAFFVNFCGQVLTVLSPANLILKTGSKLN